MRDDTVTGHFPDYGNLLSRHAEAEQFAQEQFATDRDYKAYVCSQGFDSTSLDGSYEPKLLHRSHTPDPMRPGTFDGSARSVGRSGEPLYWAMLETIPYHDNPGLWVPPQATAMTDCSSILPAPCLIPPSRTHPGTRRYNTHSSMKTFRHSPRSHDTAASHTSHTWQRSPRCHYARYPGEGTIRLHPLHIFTLTGIGKVHEPVAQALNTTWQAAEAAQQEEPEVAEEEPEEDELDPDDEEDPWAQGRVEGPTVHDYSSAR